jgi:hypothetical protein
MAIGEARTLIGHKVQLTWADRAGNETSGVVEVFEVNFVPLYGPCLLTDFGDIRVDRVIHYEIAA